MTKKIRRPKDFIAEFNRLCGLKGSDGKHLFKNNKAAFEHLNTEYYKQHDEKRYADYDSFRSVLIYHKKQESAAIGPNS